MRSHLSVVSSSAEPGWAALRSPSRRARGGAVAALVAVLLSGAVGAGAAGAQEARPSDRATAGRSERYTLVGSEVDVYNVAGTVRLVPGSGREVVVDVARRGRDAEALQVAQGPVRGREALRVWAREDRIVYPALGRSSNVEARVRDDGTFGDGGRDAMRGRTVEVRGDGRGTEAWAELTVAVPTGQRVVVHLAAGAAVATGVDGDVVLDVHGASARAERTRGRLTIDAGSGAVEVTGAEGELLLDTGSGRVELDGVRASRLRIDAGSGAVRGRGVVAESLDLDTGSGGVRLAGVRARTLRLDSGSGTVDLELVDDVEDARIDSGSGSVTLRLPATLGAALEIDTGSGGIESELPIVVSSQGRDQLVGRIGDGRGRIAINSGSGTVRLLRSDR